MLRVGIILRSPRRGVGDQVAAWIVALLQRLSASRIAEIVALLYCEGEPSIRSGLGERVERSLLRIYQCWDERHMVTQGYALSLVALPAEMAALAQAHECQQAEEVLRGMSLDLVLCLDAQMLCRYGGLARYGAVVLDVAGTYGNQEAVPMWREHSLGDVVTTRMLQILPGETSPKVLYETFTAVSPFSFSETQNAVYWKSVEVVFRSLTALHNDGNPSSLTRPFSSVSRAEVPQLGMSAFARRELRRWFRAHSQQAVKEDFAKWFIGIRSRSDDEHFASPDGYRLLTSPSDRFYADPFLFVNDGKTWLFFEDFRYGEGRAVISCCALQEDGTPQAPFEVLRLPFHLSYPFVFEHEGEIYMVPESRSNRTVSLYRAVQFPHEWTLDTELFTNAHMVDTTFHHENGTWWLFTGVSNGKYSNSDELCIYFADDLRGPWSPHPQNPVISDVRRARPAGRLFQNEGRWIRPSQNCGPAYGYGLVFSEVEVLTREAYRERVIGSLEPESVPGNTANHTYGRTKDFEVIDRFFIASRLHGTSILPTPHVDSIGETKEAGTQQRS